MEEDSEEQAGLSGMTPVVANFIAQGAQSIQVDRDSTIIGWDQNDIQLQDIRGLGGPAEMMEGVRESGGSDMEGLPWIGSSEGLWVVEGQHGTLSKEM